MTTEFTFPQVVLQDPLGTRIVLVESRTQDGCAVLRVDPKLATDPEAILNRTTAILLRKALGLWIKHLDETYVVVDGDDDELDG